MCRKFNSQKGQRDINAQKCLGRYFLASLHAYSKFDALNHKRKSEKTAKDEWIPIFELINQVNDGSPFYSWTAKEDL